MKDTQKDFQTEEVRFPEEEEIDLYELWLTIKRYKRVKE